MTKNEFLQLFELTEIYEKYKNKIPFCFSLHDRLIGTDTAIYFTFITQNEIKIHLECIEFDTATQHVQINLKLFQDNISLNQEEIFKNELFSFLTFDTNLDSSLKFLANFINKILKPKYHLMGQVFIN